MSTFSNFLVGDRESHFFFLLDDIHLDPRPFCTHTTIYSMEVLIKVPTMFGLWLTLKGPGGGGGGVGNPPPLDVSRDNFVEIFRAASFHYFFL